MKKDIYLGTSSWTNQILFVATGSCARSTTVHLLNVMHLVKYKKVIRVYIMSVNRGEVSTAGYR